MTVPSIVNPETVRSSLAFASYAAARSEMCITHENTSPFFSLTITLSKS